MFKDAKVFSSFSVDDVAKAKTFYANTLGLTVTDSMGGLNLNMQGEDRVFIYPKDSHAPATYTVLNFLVPDIDRAVDDLTKLGIQFETYDTDMIKTDEKGIARSTDPSQGPSIAWFKDPAGNFLSVIEQK